jgi:DNA invertase Pin-like site-specific DNA recombinase
MSQKKPTVMDGYIRVSRRMGREGPGYISPDVQREAIQRWADYRGVTISEWHVDEDESGGSQNRPGMRRVMERIEQGDTDGVAVWKIDRFARNVHEAIRDVKRMQARPEKAAHFASVTEDIDPTGPFGDFILTIMLAVATLQRDSLVEGWKIAKARAMDRGAKIGPTPFGYRRRDDGVLEPHPDRGPIVREAFERAAERGLDAAVDYLASLGIVHEEGKRAGSKRVWTTTTVRRVLENRAYLGEAIYGDRVELHAHPALVERALFEAAQPDPRRPRRAAVHYPLSGVARCATCGERMIGARGGKAPDGTGLRSYRCRASITTWTGARCPSPATTVADPLEALVREALSELFRETWVAQDDVEGDLVEAETDLKAAELELESLLTDAELRRTLGAERFRRLADSNVVAVEEAQARYREAASQAASVFSVPEPELVLSATAEELGELARGGLEAVVVHRGRHPIRERVQIIPRGGSEADAWVPQAQDAPDGLVEA